MEVFNYGGDTFDPLEWQREVMVEGVEEFPATPLPRAKAAIVAEGFKKFGL